MTTIGRQNVFIATGHGYEKAMDGSRCTAFDGYTVIAEPLPTRESRQFRSETGSGGTDYGSHSFKLAIRTEDAEKAGRKRDLFILVHHGGGRRVMRFRTLYNDGGAMEAALLAMPERALYCVLYSAFDTAENAANFAQDVERDRWTRASLDGRIRRRTYPSRGTAKVWIEPAREEGESEESFRIRKMLAAPPRA